MLHKYSLNGYYIVLDVYSGAVHVTDDLGYRLVDFTSENMTERTPSEAYDALNDYSRADIDEAYAEWYEAFERGQLHAADDYEQFAGRMINASLKSMCLNISHDCNLACEYCFASKGGFGGERCLMSEEVARKAIDFLIDKSVGRRNLEVDFFGGEPLLNFEVVKKTVAYARSREKEAGKNFRFTITTNGLLLDDDKIDFINREMHNCVLSIDGRPEVNDRLRKDWGGKGCHDRILPPFQKLVAQRGDKDYYARATYTRYNLDFTNDILYLYGKGFDQLSEEPVVSDPKLDFSIQEEDLPRIFEEYERLAKTLIEMKKAGEKINFFHFMIDLSQGPCAIRRLRGCSCGNEYVAVTPQGDIFPCHQFVGHDEWKMGSVLDGSYDVEMKKKFACTTVYHKAKCRDCWARFYCSGGCNAGNFEKNGNILEPYSLYCEMEKKRLECAIMMQAALADED
ncbi:MAG: thioether cross-link-forming SCIFF peptide maturase [Clostridia bacterium]|nr:thioether cross-link-forming SCIFF peptide maturase [Clostridia bacterium]MBQ1555051.1 thioether cross-link-forming SCIFF peptide maturase [Clostridia bacterium]